MDSTNVENFSEKEWFRQKCLQRIKQFRLIDDTFFSACLADDVECTEFILRILLDKDDLQVIESKTQYSVKNLQGHSVILDALATDSKGVKFNIEIQRSDKGAAKKRARYYSSLIDGQSLISGDDYEMLPEVYVIFITENDVMGRNLPIYHVERTVTETGDHFTDGSHIVYVNASNRDDTKLGRLMHDFYCANPNDMNYPLLAQKTGKFKENTKEAEHMCRIMEEIKAEGFAEGVEAERAKTAAKIAEVKAEAEAAAAAAAAAAAKETAVNSAIRMIKDGLTVEKISEYTRLPLSRVQELKALVMA